MRFSFICIGTYGDVVPYVALGAKLRQEGHEVIIGAHEHAKELCQKFSLAYYPIGGDLAKHTSKEEAKSLFEAKGLKKITAFFNVMRLLRKVLDIHLKDCRQATIDADVLIYHPAAFAGPHLAEFLKIPAIKMSLQPEILTSQHPSCLISMPKYLGKIGNLIGHFISQQFFWQIFRKKINQWRKSELNLSKTPFWRPTKYSNIKELVTFSPSLIKRPTDWHSSTGMVSFCRLKEGGRWTPSKQLIQFLEEAEKPLYLGFGSLTEAFPSEIVNTIIEVFKEKKIKAIIPKNLPGLENILLPEHILAVDYIPHDWLFPKVSAVIHHGGVGTLSAGLYAGKATWVMPCIVDQFFFGQKTFEWGIGPKPLPKVQFTKKRFEDGLKDLLRNTSYTKNALKLQKRLDQEDGTQEAYQWIIQQLEVKL
ncbi:MAG: hypothetical protein BGO10_09660 [Chlamydia sp. 32-24]|nr:MAG: hypothetical protein BGO10_09660 [Chlamydia sp. 32-24]